MKRRIYLFGSFLFALALLVLIQGGLARSATQACEPHDAGNPPGTWTKSEANPVLSEGESGAWDAGGVGSPAVWYGTYKMLYLGLEEGGASDHGPGLGFADGGPTSWTKGELNPVLEKGDLADWDGAGVFAPAALKDQQEGTYKMWYSGQDAAGTWRIGYAWTCNSALTWTKHLTPILEPGGPGEWDESVRSPVVVKEEVLLAGALPQPVGPSCTYTYTYKMWYAGQDAAGVWRIGYATSPDGVNWTKYEDNPVLEPGVFGSWDESGVLAPYVLQVQEQYGMFYVGLDGALTKRIGYALSDDGVEWTKLSSRNPMLGPGEADAWDGEAVDEPSVLLDGSAYKLWYAGQDVTGTWRIGYAWAHAQAMTDSNDLAVSGHDIWTIPANVHHGDQVTVGVNVHNLWDGTRADVQVHFYDGNPELEGTLICTATTGSIDPFTVGEAWCPAGWDTTGLYGTHKLYVVVDPHDEIGEDNEGNNVAWRKIKILPQSDDVTPPTGVIAINEGAEVTYSRNVSLTLSAQDDVGVAAMHIIEVEFVHKVGRWVAVKESGWVPYATSYDWTLSCGAGAKYLLAYFADVAGNVSAEPAWDIINYLSAEGEELKPEGVRVYRMEFTPGVTVTLTLSPTEGDVDLYVWQPGNWEHDPLDPPGAPDYVSENAGTVQETVVISNTAEGVYHVEVHNASASSPAHYTLMLEEGMDALLVGRKGGGLGAVQAPSAPVTTEQPEHNRMAIPSFGNYLYLPLVFKGGS